MYIYITYIPKKGGYGIIRFGTSGRQITESGRSHEDVKKVEIIAIGRTRIITPAGESWDSWFDGENECGFYGYP